MLSVYSLSSVKPLQYNSAYALGGSSSSLHTKLEYIAVDFKCYPLYMNSKAIAGNTLLLQLEERKLTCLLS
ncbi:hypothetical protein EB796_009501 [Bugula neritina]|uniref:Uncharacterized protein n=1 Tax=Bugula neritina TaxID=10212 RepID=A0A7J7K3N8_BUGNE|nr:hypothetical protein EB796_009501 [Bugula neritina]